MTGHLRLARRLLIDHVGQTRRRIRYVVTTAGVRHCCIGQSIVDKQGSDTVANDDHLTLKCRVSGQELSVNTVAVLGEPGQAVSVLVLIGSK